MNREIGFAAALTLLMTGCLLCTDAQPIADSVDFVQDEDVRNVVPEFRSCGDQNILQRNVYDCSSFFMCDGQYHMQFQCSPGLQFDFDKQRCDWEDKVNCIELDMQVEKTQFEVTAEDKV